MKVTLESNGGLPLHQQEVIFTGRMPELIRWEGRIFAHRFTNWPKEVTAYREMVVLDMPPPLPPTVLCNTQSE